MNCNRFRFLIQQRFDTEISPQDDRALLAHIETCESCQKFHHQVQQIILATEELNIPEELQPAGLDELASKIKAELPVSKQNLLETAFGMLNSLKESAIVKKLSGGKAKPTEEPDVKFPLPKQAGQKRRLEQEVLQNKIAQVKLPETKIVEGAFRPTLEMPTEVSSDRHGSIKITWRKIWSAWRQQCARRLFQPPRTQPG